MPTLKMAQSVDTIERTHKSRLKSFFESEIMDIVYQYFETKVLANSNLFFFLSDHKHILFHLYKPKEKCCACQSEPADKKTSVEQCIDSTLKEKQFRILFNVDNNSQTNHEVKENGRIRMHCLCIYDPKSEGDLDVTHMDICLICTLVRTCCKQNPAVNPTWLENIKEVRNIIYHSGTSDSLTKDKAEEKWGILENSAIEIAKTMGVSYIKSFKSRVLNLNAKFSFKDEMNRTLEERDANLERTLAERDANLERTLVERDAKLDRTFDEKIADLIERIKTEIKEHTICVEEKVCLQVNNTELVSTTTEDVEGESSISGQVSNDRRYVVWKFRSRGEWDVQKVMRKLESFAIIADFDVEFQYLGSLIIVTSTLTWFLTNEFVFKSAVKRFLTLFGKLIAKEEAASEKLFYIDVDIEVCYKKPPRYTEKTESSQRVVPDFPDDRKVLQNSGLLQSDFEMEESSKRVVTDFPDERKTLHNSGLLQSDFEMEESSERVVPDFPDDRKVLQNSGLLQSDFEMEESSERVVPDFPDDRKVLQNLGLLQSDFEMEESSERVVPDFPDDRKVLQNLGLLQSDFEMEESSKRVVTDFPDERKVLQNSGLLQSDFEMEGLQEKEEDESFLKSTESESYSKNVDISDNMIHTDKPKRRRVVAAIDFGTTYSGFAYCKRSAYDENPVMPTIIIKDWKDDTHITEKTPTCVLFKPDRTLFSFGYEAISYYHENPDKIDFRDWYYFEHFKMILYQTDELTADTDLPASNDSADSQRPKMKAVDVFGTVIKFMKDQLMEDLQKTETRPFKDEDIQWVITVPAIWDLRARQFMRDAAKKAQISHDQILLALEPEAASLFCRRVPVGDETIGEGRRVISGMCPGSKYIVLDQGGGTTDIAIHEINGINSLKEIHQACGGHWGGTTVNTEFRKFLDQLLGEEFLMHMKKADPSSYFLLFYRFEQAKTSFKSEDESDTEGHVSIPFSWQIQYDEFNPSSNGLAEKMNKSNYSNDAKILKDKLKLKKSCFRKFYDYSIKSVVTEISNLLEKPQVRGIKTLLVVGGHSASTVFTDALKSAFKELVVVVPKDPSATVLNGAILYGFEPGTITFRVSRFTYGVGTIRAFQKGHDPEEKKIIVEGKEKCQDVFSKHIDIDQEIEVGEDKYQPAKEYVPLYKTQESVSYKFFDTKSSSPRYTTDSGCRHIGSLLFKLTRMSGDRTMDLEINFSGTELKARVTEKGTKKNNIRLFYATLGAESSERVVPDFPDDRKVLQNSGLLQSDFEMEGLQEKEEDESFLKSTERESYSKNFDISDNMIHMIKQRKLVAAVHIGTTYSGFAYCKRIAYDNNETPEIVTHKWITDIYITENTPTCVLFKPSRTLHSFGYDAIRHYQENPDEEDFMDWYYFENLDMMLDKAGEYTAESDLLESNGSRDSKKTRMKAVDVLSAVIKFMKGQLLKDLQNTYVIPITDEEIQWMIAIPAIWDIRARELTEMAAFKAGIHQDQILLALEPEAASLFCKRFPGDLNRSTVMDRMKIGSKYIVLILDQDGRPTGIGVYEITGLHSSREIHQTGVDHLGKTTVIAEFQNFLEHLLGKEFVHHMKMLDPPSYFSVFNEFKQAMTCCSFEEERAKATIRIPVSWLTKYKDWHRMEMKKRLKQSVYSDEAGIRKDKLTMKMGLLRRFYDPLINSVSKEIQNILKEISGVNILFLVGNPSTSAVLSDSLKTVFEDVLIVVPKEPACALLKGAVMYGFDPPTIKRISNKKSNRHVEANEERMQAEELQFIGNIRLLLNSF